MSVIEYKCPNCGGKLEFDSTLQKMKCPYCDSIFDVEELDKQEEIQSQKQDTEIEDDHLKLYVCQSCGGEIVTDETTAATSCPFCGNPVILSGQVSGDIQPDYVIPFKLTKEDAIKALERHISGKKLLPKVFKDENHINEIKGVYVPYWLFNMNADTYVQLKGIKERSWSDGNFRYVEKNYYDIVRDADIPFQHIPLDASSKMDDALMESIEPFDFSEAVSFKTAYLSGFFANRYDVQQDDLKPRADERVKESAVLMMRNSVQGYSSCNVESSTITIHDEHVEYALYPVWILSTTWNNNNYIFAMNGQTGRMVGDLPMDKGLYWKYFFIYLIVFTLIFGAIAMFIMN